MTNQLKSLDGLNLTQVSVTLPGMADRKIRFVTDMSYRRVVLRVLSITRDWCVGDITQDEAVLRIVSDIPHVPVLGDHAEVTAYVDSRGGHHVHADYDGNMVYVGHNDHNDTWGHVTIGSYTRDIVWDRGAEVAGPIELFGDMDECGIHCQEDCPDCVR